MKLDRLGEIELDPVAPVPEYDLGELEDGRVHDQIGHMWRADQKAAEPLGPCPVEAAFTKRRRLVAWPEILGDRAD